ncbi:cation transporter [Photobacterium ganghwense]|uniref:Cobalt-zinc-cadmium resistance protein n=1 Tax=Photobacterium ganghwense TaxID=320778 RepID=A0A0J1HIU9_9GAMM|nr:MULTISPECIES: cation transporter [Photobacterium]KLV11544.1 cobalt-zinc-cadmium resistance protein [Photobacterium ganghwense]PSU08413.1 cation transporter [Photobacterium ganghwense]
MLCNVSLERKLLKFSTISALFFALMGIGLGLWMGSLVIVFDGAYSLVSLALTLVSLAAASYIRSPKARKNPRLGMIEPGVIAFKGLVIALMCALSFSSAVSAMISGGREVDAGLALLFGVVNVVGCIASYMVMVRYGKKAQSALVTAESKQWLMDTVISAAVMAGFIVASLLTYVGMEEYAVYADPAMVVVASLYFVIVPLKMMAGALKRCREQYELSMSANWQNG